MDFNIVISSTPAISKSEIEAVLSRVRSLSEKSHSIEARVSQSVSEPSFNQLMNQIKGGLATISKTQMDSDSLKQQYLSGSSEVSLSQVLVSSARSKVAFEGLIAVRKLFIEAYKEVMNMPV